MAFDTGRQAGFILFHFDIIDLGASSLNDSRPEPTAPEIFGILGNAWKHLAVIVHHFEVRVCFFLKYHR